MATTPSITSLGIGSGIDANSIVTKLMALERAPLDALTLRESSYKAKISAFGTIKSKFDALETAAGKLADPAKLAGFTATIGNEDILSATPGTFAGAGSYAVEVVQLAQAQKSLSINQYAGGTTFGAGTLRFTIDGTDTDIAFAGGSISDVRNAINAANIGVTATTVTSDAGTRLVLTAKDTGTEGAFTLTALGGDANLLTLDDFDAAHANARTAQNAIVKVEGDTITSQSNSISGAIPDVTITAKTVGTTTVDVARSSATAVDTVKAFVTAYNDVVKELRSASAYDAGTKIGGPLNGDATVRTLQGLLSSNASEVPAALEGTAYETLSALGIAFQKDGTLALDETKLKKAIDTDFGAVTNTLNVFGAQVAELAEDLTAFDGLLAARTDGLGATVSRIAAQKTTLEYRLSLTEKRMRAQFTALDTLMGQLSTTGAYLTQQLSNLNA